jgi:radical SAM superfamily enzyme YgiQ (UPF0313 family)
MKKIYLVQSPIDFGVNKTPYVIPPLGVLSLATFLKRESSDLSIKVADGDLIGLEAVKEEIERFRPDVVGVSTSSSETYRSALEIARSSKQYGARVIFGGEQASVRAEQIVNNRAEVDGVVVGQGEIPLLYIISGNSYEEIPNLVFRDSLGNTRRNPEGKPLRLNNHQELPIPDRTFVDILEYARRFQETKEAKLTGAKCYGSTRTQYGCLKAMQNGPCVFCSRTDLDHLDFRKPEIFWEEMQQLLSVGIDYVWEVAPNFTSVSRSYLEKLATQRPKSSNMRMRVYASPRDGELCDEEKVELLARIGVENVLAGFESGDQRCLDSSNKHITLEEHIRSVKNLRKYGLTLCSAFIIGLPGETRESMYRTLNHARNLRELIGHQSFRVVTASVLQPYPGTQVFEECIRQFPNLREQMERDILDMNSISRKYIEGFLHLDMEEVVSVIEKLRDLAPIGSGKGPAKIKYGV